MHQKSLGRLVAQLMLFLCFFSSLGQAKADDSFCWKESFGRGVGTLPSACPNGFNHELAACYTTCQKGFEAYSPGAVTCEQTCPSGFTDMPGTCTKPSPTSSAGYPWKFGDGFNLDGAMGRCRADNPSVGCYVSGAIVYPNCSAGFHKVGDLVCSPNCPAGMSDGGVFCSKQIYTRSMTTPGCASGLENESGLCYPSCGSGFSGSGPVCWSQCPTDHPFVCGAACATSQSACAAAVGDMVTSTVGMVIDIATMPIPGAGAALGDAMKVAKTARSLSILAEEATTGERTLLTGTKAFAGAYGKQFAKSITHYSGQEASLYSRAAKLTNTEIGQINKAATEFGQEKTDNVFDLTALTMLDPTGVSGMVTSFTKYGSCTSTQFAVDRSELTFGDASRGSTQSFYITAQRPTQVTRIAAPAFLNTSITPTADCIGKQMSPSDVCKVTVTVRGNQSVDGEVRIYTDQYGSFPMGIHLTANPTVATVDTTKTGVDEAANLTDVAGVWSLSQNQSKKMTITSDGGVATWSGNGSVAATGDAGRAFTFNTSIWNATMTLNSTGDRLTVTPRANTPIGIKGSPLVLSISYYSQAEDANLIAWTNNNVSAQNFTFASLGDGTYRIVNSNSGKVLGLLNNGTVAGTQVVQQTWSGRPGQIYRLESLGNGDWYRVVNLGTDLALTVGGSTSVKGANMTVDNWSDLDTQHFTMTTDAGNMVRRPWDKGCNAGERNYAGLCYDVPPGNEMTFPGVMGQVCPADWRDDGTWCWPTWTGVAVPSQADPNGGDNLRHPIVVTSCSSYNQTNNQSCPANFTRSAVCSCQASAISKNVSTISGHLPN